ncbi:MAG TPA: DUF11 domain-containing protein, partial [Candidatus Limnocylindrales bacterium]|nr:DUF11 domain-containing protein [Candidatus Limnocylindrales bacterium]
NPIAGTPDNLVADAASTIIVNGTASGVALPASVTALLGLTVNNAAGLALNTDLTVEGTLDLAGGDLDTGASRVTIGPAGSLVRVAGHVVGRLRKPIPVGLAVSAQFEVGDSAVYAPISLAFDETLTSGLVTVSTTGGDHPQLAGSSIDPSLSVNRYWTATAESLAFTTYQATLNWAASDADPATTPSAFIVSKLDGGAWSIPAVTDRQPTSITVAGMASFSSFAVGMPGADLAIAGSAQPDPVVAGMPLTYTLVVSNAGPADAVGVSVSATLAPELNAGTYCIGAGCDSTAGVAWTTPIALGDLPSGSAIELRLVATVHSDTPAGAVLTSDFVATATTYDPFSSNDSASVLTDVDALADLAVTKDGPESAVAGGPGVDYVIEVTNEGPSDQVGGIIIRDSLPSGESFVPGKSDGSCTASGQIVTCTLPSGIPAGSSRTVNLHAALELSAAGSVLGNTATVFSDGTADPNSNNDVSNTVVTSVVQAPLNSVSPSPGDLPDTRVSDRLWPMTTALGIAAFALLLLLAALMAVAVVSNRRGVA